MKKKLLTGALILGLLLGLFSGGGFARQKAIRLNIYGKYVSTDTDPIIVEGRTLVPLRVISEELGYDVGWDQENKAVSVVKADYERQIPEKVFLLYINQPAIYDIDTDYIMSRLAGGERIEPKSYLTRKEIDIPPIIINDRTLVPVRAVAEEFGLQVDWDDEERTVIIK